MTPPSATERLSHLADTPPVDLAQVLLDRWRRGVLSLPAVLARAPELPGLDLVEVLSADQYERWCQGERTPVEDLLQVYPAVAADADAACELVYCEFRLRLDLDETPLLEEYLERFPALADRLRHKHTLELRQSLLHGLSVAETPQDAAARRWRRPIPPDLPDYELLKWIGAGTFGQVWLARNRHDHGFCAVKVIPKLYPVELKGVRLYRECASDHPFLVPIKHVGEFEEFFYYVMPLADDVREGTLSATVPDRYEALTLRRHLADRGSLTIDEVVTVARHLLSALAQLHERGVRHCDVKPDNVLRLRGTWQLGDVGLAARSAEMHGDRGTPAFWPPESPHDQTADLYALGKTLYLLATGTGLERFQEFADGTLRIPGGDRRAEPLRRIILRACQRDPGQRFPSAPEMRRALDKLLAGRGRRSRLLTALVLLAGGACLVLALALSGFWKPGPGSDLPSPPRRPELTGEDAKRDKYLDEQFSQCYEECKWDEAKKPLQEQWDLRRRVLGAQHPLTRSTEAHLDTQRKFVALPPEAQAEYREAWFLRTELVDCVRQGRYDDALALEERRLEITRRLLGENNYETARSYQYRASLMARCGNYPAPLIHDSRRRSLTIYRLVLGDEHLDTLVAFNNLAAYLHSQGMYVEAELLNREALKLRLNLFGEIHLYTGTSYLNLGKNLANQENHARAEEMYEKVKEIAGRLDIWIPDNPLPLYLGLAAQYAKLGRHDEAERLHREVVRIQKLLMGGEHYVSADAYCHLVFSLDAQDKDTTEEKRQALLIVGRLWARHASAACTRPNTAWLEAALRYGLLKNPVE